MIDDFALEEPETLFDVFLDGIEAGITLLQKLDINRQQFEEVLEYIHGAEGSVNETYSLYRLGLLPISNKMV